jgi:hypothetical protein
MAEAKKPNTLMIFGDAVETMNFHRAPGAIGVAS